MVAKLLGVKNKKSFKNKKQTTGRYKPIMSVAGKINMYCQFQWNKNINTHVSTNQACW